MLCGRSINYFFDTSAEPSLRQKEFAEPDWLPSLFLCDSSRLRSAANKKAKLLGQSCYTSKRERVAYTSCLESTGTWRYPSSLARRLSINLLNICFPVRERLCRLTPYLYKSLQCTNRKRTRLKNKEDYIVPNILAEQDFDQKLV